MAELQLPHTPGCMVCGRENERGLKQTLFVDDHSGLVSLRFTPPGHLIGYEGIVHGGALATLADEAMVWAATWRARRFCVCGEITVRYRRTAPIGEPLRFVASVVSFRPRLIQTNCEIHDAQDNLIAAASAKCVPLGDDENRRCMRSLVPEPAAQAAWEKLCGDLESNPGDIHAATRP